MTINNYGFTLSMAVQAKMSLADMKAVEDLAFDELPDQFERIRFMQEQTGLRAAECCRWDKAAYVNRVAFLRR